MTLYSAILAELPFLRSEAESLMTLTLTAYAPNGVIVDGGYEVRAYAAQGSTPGKVQGPAASTADTSTRYVTVGETERPVLEAGLHLPIAAPVPVAGLLGIGWEYVVTAVGMNDDPSLLSRRYLVVETPAKSYATARRLDVVQL